MQIREYLEKNYKELPGAEAVKLCIKSLMEMLEVSGKTIEVMVMEKAGLRALSAEEVDAVVKEVEAEAAAAEAARKAQADAQ